MSSARRGEYCVGLGAEGYIDRSDFAHWGIPPHWEDRRAEIAQLEPIETIETVVS